MIDSYKINKQQILDQSLKKFEIKKMVAGLKTDPAMTRTSSLPRLSKKPEILAKNCIILPSYE